MAGTESEVPFGFKVSETTLADLEDVWRNGRNSPMEHVRQYQCARGLLSFADNDKSAYLTILKLIADRTGLNSEQVWKCLQTATESNILHVGASLHVMAAATLREKLNGLKCPTGGSPDVQLVVVAAVQARHGAAPSDRVAAAARAAAEYIHLVVPGFPMPEERGPYTSGWIGVSGGTTMLSVVAELEARNAKFPGLEVFPLAGEAEPDEFQISANSVVAQLGSKCGIDVKTHALMTTPYVGKDTLGLQRWREAMENNVTFQNVIKNIRHVKFAFTGIGEPEEKDESGVPRPPTSPRDPVRHSALHRLGRHCDIGDVPDKCVGDICYLPMDENGEDAWPPLSDRLLGLKREDLRTMATTENRRVVAVACGRLKVRAIIAAVRARFVNALITDELTALEILNELGS
jgi:DNA-binding transcriptional regulator LsrR (DeoR family)